MNKIKQTCCFGINDRKEVKKVIDELEKLFSKLPHLPKGLVNFLVSVLPWLALLGGLFSVAGSLSLIAGNHMAQFVTSWSGINPVYFRVAGVFQLLTGVLLFLAFKPLKSKDFAGWMYLFWVMVLGLVSSVTGFLFSAGSVVSLVIGLAIQLYFLFELKPEYKTAVSKD
ncbi:MAG: hypothetical protein ABID04_02365 [Patescibacteria group bacterium]